MQKISFATTYLSNINYNKPLENLLNYKSIFLIKKICLIFRAIKLNLESLESLIEVELTLFVGSKQSKVFPKNISQYIYVDKNYYN